MTMERTGHHGPAVYDGKSQVDPAIRPAWFTEHVESIPDVGRRLLEEYSGIAPNEVIPHVVAVRDKAFRIWSYACIGQVRFLDFKLQKLPNWSKILPRLRSGATFLDAGCCFAQEIRFLAFNEKISAEQLYGFDLELAFVNMGYELFRDRGKLRANLFAGDIFANPTAPEGKSLTDLEGQMDVVHAASFLHCWGWDDMITATKRLVSLARKEPGSLVLGSQMGSLDAGQYPMPTGKGFNYRHNVDSMQRFWCQVGEETDSKWEVQSDTYVPATIKEYSEFSWAKADPNMRLIWFCATRIL